jgi:hypothetical protein
MDVAWDEERRSWRGHADLGTDLRVEVVIASRHAEPALARSYAEQTLGRLVGRLGEARQYAARQLAGHYNDFQAHLPDGEHVTDEEFAGRLHLERLRFLATGAVRLDFRHDLYRGDPLFAGGLVVVEATPVGQFRRASWVTEPDARPVRRTRIRPPKPRENDGPGHGEPRPS